MTLLRRPDWYVRARYLRGVKREVGDGPVLVFSLGKTGTTSIMRMVEGHRPALHCHKIVPEPSDDRWPRAHGRPWAAWRAELAGRMVRAGRWDVVCGVRDPIARAASALFQVGARGDMAAEVTAFLESGRAGLDWFRAQLEPVTGVDVFSVSFAHEQGWQIYESDRFRVLLVRFENLAAAPEALRAFGLPVRDLVHVNDGRSKRYSDEYAHFKNHTRLPTDLVDEVLDSELAEHFYTAAERDRFRERWTDQPGSARR